MDDLLGDRMKMYEMADAGRKTIPLLPVMARLDGKCFSKFTKGLRRPYDVGMSELMQETTKWLCEETCALAGYTQSDEITLLWYSGDSRSQIYFDGRIQKMVSVLAGLCSVFFNRNLPLYLPIKKNHLAVFDCRVWQLPTLTEAANTFLWRELDATKNSISMAAQHYFSHNELMNKNGTEKMEMLFQKGINWDDYPNFFKRGSYVIRRTTKSKLTEKELESLPPLHNARKNPEMEFDRSEYCTVDLPPLNKVLNRVDVICNGAAAIIG